MNPKLGPIFARHIKNWPQHYETLTDFWTVQTGGPAGYQGRLLRTHAPLHLRTEDFNVWLAQWRQSCHLHFADAEATEMIALAERLCARMRDTVASPE